MSHYQPFTGACFGTSWKPNPVPMGPDAAFLWNRQQYSGTPYNNPFPMQGELDMAAQLAKKWQEDRLYRRDPIDNPCFGKQPAVAMPPYVPQTTQQPSDLSRSDMPTMNPIMDEVYRENLYVKPFFLDTPIVTNQQLHGGFSVNTLVA